MRDHGIVLGVWVLGDVEIFLNNTPRVGEERPVGTDSTAIFILLSDIVGADCAKVALWWISYRNFSARICINLNPSAFATPTITGILKLSARI